MPEAELSARCPAATILRVSAATGDGITAWLEAVLASAQGGSRRIEVDYDTYAAGEAVLGWLNATVELTGGNWEIALPHLMTGIALPGIAHLKCFLRSNGLVLVANRVTGRPSPMVRRLTDGRPGTSAQVIVNARVACTPDALRQAVENAVATLGMHGRVKSIRAFSPGRPVPVHRI